MTDRTLPAIVRLLWRRRGWILFPTLLGVAAAWVALERSEPVYRASTLVLVEPQKIPTDYVKPTVTSDLSGRLKSLEAQITSRENLQGIIEKLGLYPELVAQGRLDPAIWQLRRDLLVESRGGSVFRIHVKGGDPEKIATVANHVAEAFIEENLRLRQNQASSTTAFLDSELETLKARLEEAEQRVAAFRRGQDGSLPEQRVSNEAALQRLQTRLDMAQQKADGLELKRLVLRGGLSAVPGDPGDPPTLAIGTTRLRDLEQQLAELRSRYTEKHPEILRIRHEMELLEQGMADSAPLVTKEDIPFVDPVARAELDAVEVELARLRAERESIVRETGLYQARLENTARVELELLDLTRDYDNLQGSYDSLLGKRTDAKLAENLERDRQSEQFTILERAAAPSEPYAPQPLLYLMTGLAAGFVAGLGLVFIREETDQTFADPGSLRRAFPSVPVLGSIPRISVVEADRRLGRGAA